MSASDAPTFPSGSLSLLLTEASRLHRRQADWLLSDISLYVGQDRLLKALADGPLNMGEIAIVIGVQPPTVTKMVSRMEAAGLVLRSTHPDDARQSIIHLTPLGSRTEQQIDDVWRELDDLAFGNFSDVDREQLFGLLRRLWENLAEAAVADEPEEVAA